MSRRLSANFFNRRYFKVTVTRWYHPHAQHRSSGLYPSSIGFRPGVWLFDNPETAIDRSPDARSLGNGIPSLMRVLMIPAGCGGDPGPTEISFPMETNRARIKSFLVCYIFLFIRP